MGATTTSTGTDGSPKPGSEVQEENPGHEVPEAHPGSVDRLLCEEHADAPVDDRPWLPKQDRGDLAPHPFCPDCGEVQAVDGPPALDRGGLVNLISRLEELLEREGHVVTEVQKRILMKRLVEAGADDGFGLTRKRQLVMIAQTAEEILGLPETVVYSYLRTA